MKLRHEWKHEISEADRLVLQTRFGAALYPDTNGIGGRYEIRSLYFDDDFDTALREKLDGVSRREKFRIRYYNGDTSWIRLEKKSKICGLCEKQSTRINADEALKIASNEIAWMAEDERPLIRELYTKMRHGLHAKTIVDYARDAYVFPAGNVRVTLDYNIRTGLLCTDFLNTDCITIPAGDAPTILEVKWDEYLPDLVRDLVQLPGRRSSAFSKYAACRIYG